MRLRILDLNTPWFWLTVFFQKRYGKPWIEIAIWTPNTWKNFWLNVWQWEGTPMEVGKYSTGQVNEFQEKIARMAKDIDKPRSMAN
jgi:hypothetical protein